MEEDIKVLEELIEHNYLEDVSYLREDNDYKKFNQALENLIKGYRELEKQLDSSRKANELLNKTNNELRLEIRTTYSKVVNDIISKFNLGDEYIPKSKIKEKIEDLNDYKSEFCQRVINHNEHTLTEFVQNILKEIMEHK